MTQPDHSSVCEYDAAQYLTLLEALCQDVQAATLAAASIRAADLWQCVRELEANCARLEHAWRRRETTLDVRSDRALGTQILAAHRRLNQLNRTLAALLRRRSQSVGLLRRHYQSLSGTLDEDPGQTARLHHWITGS